MDAIELLSHDHRMVEQLFRDYQAAANDQQRRAVVEVLVRELSKHAALEELMVYPMAEKVLPEVGPRIDERLAEHMNIKKSLAALDKLGPGDEHTDRLVAELRLAVERHVRQDEGELLPELRDALDEQALAELGEALDGAKRIAPTRPHPNAPGRAAVAGGRRTRRGDLRPAA